MKTVVIVEDYKLMRDGYKSMISREHFQVVGEAGEGMAAVKCIFKLNPDMILLDLSLPKMDGMAVLREIRRPVRRSPAKVLVLTMNDSENVVAEAFESGADGFCLKETSAQELIFAMREVLKGNRYISSEIAQLVLSGYLSTRNSYKEGLMV